MRFGGDCRTGRHVAFRLRVGVFLALCSFWAAGMRRSFAAQEFKEVFVVLWEDIGLAPGALVSLNITNTADTQDVVLVILTQAQWSMWTGDPRVTFSKNSSYLISEYRAPFDHQVVVRHRIEAPRVERYYFGVLNVHHQHMVLQGSMEFENPFGEHLPYQWVHMPDMLWFMTVAFGGIFVVMALILVTVWIRGATLLHAVLLLCLLLKTVNLALHWKYFDVVSRVGDVPWWRFEAWQLARRLHAISEIFLLLLTALGWKLLRARLSTTELKFMALAFCASVLLAMLQGWSTIRSKEPEDDNNEPFRSFELIFYIIRVVCYLVIIFAMNLNLQLIEIHLRESPFTRTSAILYHKKQTYLGFRRIFVVLVFRPSCTVLLELLVIPRPWAYQGLGEVCMIAVYISLFYIMRPIFARGYSRQHRFMILMQEPSTGEDSGSDSELEAAITPLDAREVDPEAPQNGTGSQEPSPARRRPGSRSPAVRPFSSPGSADAGRQGLRPRSMSSGWSMPQPVDEADINVNYIPLAGD